MALLSRGSAGPLTEPLMKYGSADSSVTLLLVYQQFISFLNQVDRPTQLISDIFVISQIQIHLVTSILMVWLMNITSLAGDVCLKMGFNETQTTTGSVAEFHGSC